MQRHITLCNAVSSRANAIFFSKSNPPIASLDIRSRQVGMRQPTGHARPEHAPSHRETTRVATSRARAPSTRLGTLSTRPFSHANPASAPRRSACRAAHTLHSRNRAIHGTPDTRHSTALCTIGRFAYRPTARLRTSSDTRCAHSHARRQHTQHHSHKGTHRTTRLANPDHTRDTQAH